MLIHGVLRKTVKAPPVRAAQCCKRLNTLSGVLNPRVSHRVDGFRGGTSAQCIPFEHPQKTETQHA